MVFIWALFMRNAFDLSRSFALFADNEFLLGAVLSSMSNTVRNYEWPLKLSAVMGGIPLFNNPQLSPFYPLYFIFLPIYSTINDAITSIHLLVLFHLLIYEINLYILLRTLKCTRLASITAAAIIAFSANSYVYALWINATSAYAWLPLYLAGLIQILSGDVRRSSIFFLVIGGLLLIFAAPAQPLIHMLFIALILTIFYWGFEYRFSFQKIFIKKIKILVYLHSFIFLLACPVLLPAIFDLSGMIRFIGHSPAIIGSAKIPFEAFQEDQLTLFNLSTLFINIKTLAVGNPWIGPIAIFLVLLAVFTGFRKWHVSALLFLAVYGLWSALGSNGGLAYLNYHLPLINKIREPSRHIFIFVLATGLLAGIGLDYFSKAIITKDGNNKKLILTLLALVTTISLALVVREYVRVGFMVTLLIPTAILIIWVLIFCFANKLHVFCKSYISIVLSFSLLIGATSVVPWKPPGILDASSYHTKGYGSLDKVLDWIKIDDPTSSYRVIFSDGINSQEAAMLASYKGIRSFTAYMNPMPYQQFIDIYFHGGDPNGYYKSLGAKYLICKNCDNRKLGSYRLIKSIDDISIFVTLESAPHFYLGSISGESYSSTADYKTKINKSDFNTSLIDINENIENKLDITQFQNKQFENSCTLSPLLQKENSFEIEVICNEVRILAINEYFVDYWKGYLDNKRVNLLRVNGNQIGMLIPPGSHKVDILYRPNIFIVSLVISLLGLAFFSYFIFFKIKYL